MMLIEMMTIMKMKKPMMTMLNNVRPVVSVFSIADMVAAIDGRPRAQLLRPEEARRSCSWYHEAVVRKGGNWQPTGSSRGPDVTVSPLATVSGTPSPFSRIGGRISESPIDHLERRRKKKKKTLKDQVARRRSSLIPDLRFQADFARLNWNSSETTFQVWERLVLACQLFDLLSRSSNPRLGSAGSQALLARRPRGGQVGV